MKKQNKTVTEYVLNENEAKLVAKCLEYVLHRLRVHQKPRNINASAVEDLKRYLPQ
jgi:hypothetical protein